MRHAVTLASAMLASAAAFSATSCGIVGMRPLDTVTSPVWLDDGYIYYLRGTGSEPLELWRMNPSGGSDRFVDVTAEICPDGSIQSLFGIAEGRLGIGKDCPLENSSPGDGIVTVLISYTPASGLFQEVARLPPVSYVTMQSDGIRGYADSNAFGCSGIAPFDETGLKHFDSPFAMSGHVWRLDGLSRTGNCLDLGIASFPQLSPDGGRVLFLATSDAVGKRLGYDFNRTHLSWQLWSWEIQTRTFRRIATGLSGAGEFSISPDGLVAVLTLREPGAEKLVKVDLVTGAVTSIRNVKAYDPTFSPDGNQFAFSDGFKTIRTGQLSRP